MLKDGEASSNEDGVSESAQLVAVDYYDLDQDGTTEAHVLLEWTLVVEEGPGSDQALQLIVAEPGKDCAPRVIGTSPHFWTRVAPRAGGDVLETADGNQAWAVSNGSFARRQ